MPVRSRYPLPINPEPPGVICFTVRVPDDFWYIAAFKGAIYDLSKPYVWENDSAHTALRAGKRWLQVFQELDIDPDCGKHPENGGVEECCFMLRVNPDNPCELQQFCGGEWVHFWGAADCPALGGTTQPTTTDPLTPGQTKCFDVNMNASDSWLLPITVSTNDQIAISDLNGAWNDGTTFWQCLNGTRFFAGACGAAAAFHDGSDPSSVAFHMQPIAKIAGAYYPLVGGTLIVPSGITDEQVTIQANDVTLTDNSGNVNFKLCVTRQQANRSITYVNGTGPGSYIPGEAAVMTGTAVMDGGNTVYFIEFTLPGPCENIVINGTTGWSLYNVSPSNAVWGENHCTVTNSYHRTGDPTTSLPASISNTSYVLLVSFTPFSASLTFNDV